MLHVGCAAENAGARRRALVMGAGAGAPTVANRLVTRARAGQGGVVMVL